MNFRGTIEVRSSDYVTEKQSSGNERRGSEIIKSSIKIKLNTARATAQNVTDSMRNALCTRLRCNKQCVTAALLHLMNSVNLAWVCTCGFSKVFQNSVTDKSNKHKK